MLGQSVVSAVFLNRRTVALAVIAVVLALLAINSVRSAHGAVIIVVDSTADNVLNNSNCTFREAITAANTNTKVDGCDATGGGLDDIIQFDLESADIDNPATPPRISIGATPLPDITERVHIEGNQGNSHPPRMVEIRGPGAPLVSGHNGLTIAAGGAGTIVEGLVINGAADDGVLILADEVTLYDDRIGTDSAGEAPIQNQGFGVQVQANGDRVGSNDQSNCPYGCILVSGNVKANVLLDVASTGARVFGAHLGTDLTGGAILDGPGTFGIIDKGSNNRIGDPANATPGSSCNGGCNVIIGIPEAVLIDTGAINARVQANIIGLNGGGDFPASETANYDFGIVSKADGVLIGGAAAEDRNTVAAASVAQIIVEGHDSVIQGNYIGTQSNGRSIVADGGYGIQSYQSVGTVIGGVNPGMGNVIAGSQLSSVDIYLSSGVQVLGNYIGIADDGTTLLAVGHYGVSVEQGSSSNFIGGTSDGAGNIITGHDQAGVWVDNSAPVVHNNSIHRNSIYGNGIGIDLANGANDDVLPPTIVNANPVAGSSCAGCAVEIFSDSGDEGKKYEGTVLADSGGGWIFASSVSGPNVTATTTDLVNDTSEFSEPVVVFTPTPTPSPPPTPSPSPTTTPTGHIQGDLNCDGFVDINDFDFLLEFPAGLNDGMTSGCYTLGGQGIGPYAWGDLNCDGFVDGLDALFVLAYLADVTPPLAGSGCVPAGQGV
jgi:CSLREA domain-containing protein